MEYTADDTRESWTAGRKVVVEEDCHERIGIPKHVTLEL
jgi:hypothetical protein